MLRLVRGWMDLGPEEADLAGPATVGLGSFRIPVIRQKIESVLTHAGIPPDGHQGRYLHHILETYPRDELFHASVQDLARTTVGILNLQDRQRVKFFLRRDSKTSWHCSDKPLMSRSSTTTPRRSLNLNRILPNAKV